MSRFELIEKEINKGVKVDEKSNVVIQGWSPNNVRRLIIGVDYVIVQYFVSVGKYPKIVEVIPLGKTTKEDYDALKENKYVPLLKVLTANRVISSIEEIVFCVKGYPKELLNRDMDLNVLGKDTNLSNRFVRLNNVSIVNIGVKEIMPYVQSTLEADVLLKDTLENAEGLGGFKSILDLHTDDWFLGTNLRSRWYSMDKEGSALHSYFTKLKDKKELELKEAKLKEIDLKKHEKLANTDLKVILSLLKEVMTMIDDCNSLLDNYSVIDRLEWGSHIKKDSILSSIKKAIHYVPNNLKGSDSNFEMLGKKLRRVDIGTLISIGKHYNVPNVDVLENFERDILDKLMLDDSYKRESNKVTEDKGVTILQKVVIQMLNTVVNATYLAVIKYCSKAGVSNIEFYKNNLGLDTSNMKYTRSLVSYCNSKTKTEDNGDLLKAMGCMLVESNDFTVDYKVKIVKQLIDVLKNK